MVARDAHCSHGLAERRSMMLKEMLVKVVREFQAQSPLMMRIAMTQGAQTINRMANNHGCSPAGCVFGVNPQPRYPIWCQFTSSYDERSQLPDDEAIGLQQSCARSFVLASHKASFRRPLLAQVCRQPGPFEMHKVVMYKRLGGAKSALPRLIGKGIHGSLLAHRRVAVLAHPNNMGRAV